MLECMYVFSCNVIWVIRVRYTLLVSAGQGELAARQDYGHAKLASAVLSN